VIEVRIASLNADASSGQPVVLLKRLEDASAGEDRLLPIWIGQSEATAILMALHGAEMPRPMTHDLLANVVASLGFVVERVEVTRLDEGTYYAAIVLRGEERTLVIDARPSDGIALSVRASCPLFVADDVWEQAAVSVTTVGDAEEEVERFRDFLNHVDPSDFMS
jgi:bifunctional DNase/RNase